MPPFAKEFLFHRYAKPEAFAMKPGKRSISMCSPCPTVTEPGCSIMGTGSASRAWHRKLQRRSKTRDLQDRTDRGRVKDRLRAGEIGARTKTQEGACRIYDWEMINAAAPLFHICKSFHCLGKICNRLVGISMFDTIPDAMLNMSLQHHLTCLVER